MSNHKVLDCYESPGIEEDFEKLNEESSRNLKRDPFSISVFKGDPIKFGQSETLEEKINRIKSDLYDLKEELIFLGDKEKEVKTEFPEEDIDYLKEIEVIEKEMTEIIKIQGMEKLTNEYQKSKILIQDVLLKSNKENFQKKIDEIFKKIDNFENNEEEGANLKFEIFLNNSSNKQITKIKFKNLEERLSKLEELIGLGKNPKLEINLMSKIDEIFKLANTLNFQRLEGVARKVQAINGELDVVLGKHQQILNNTPEFKTIENLFEKFVQAQQLSSELPTIIDRLENLKIMHENSSVNSDITIIKDNQKEIEEKLIEYENNLKRIYIDFCNKLKEINEKIDNLEKDIIVE